MKKHGIFWFIRIGFMAIFVLFAYNLYILQIQEGVHFKERAEAQQSASEALEVKRGKIYVTDKHKNTIPAVLNKEYPTVFAVPIDIEDPYKTAILLSHELVLDEDELRKKLSKEKDKYELLIERATQEEVDIIRSLDIEGLHVRYETFRYYPFGQMASHVFGFIAPGDDGNIAGRYGVELFKDDSLKAKERRFLSSAQDGNDIYLTIDRNIQVQAEKVLATLVDEWNADGGSIIVQDPLSGRIRALANLPTFNPNTYYEYEIGDYLNTSVQAVYEPGSVFKVVTMSSAFDTGVITPETTYEDKGFVTLNSRTIRNWDLKAHGIQTMRDVIEKSLNTGTIFAEQKMGHETFYSYTEAFGFHDKTGISLPGEVVGNFANINGGRDIHYATASFGQGISTTPLALINAVSAIANKGILLKPLILEEEETQVVRRVISKEAAETMTDILVSSVDTNIIAHIPSYNVAGKTGTAFIPDFNKGGYSDDVINTFIGFAPASDPAFTILIKLDKPENAPLAGQTVVPAFKKFAQFLLNYYEIAPDREL